jgi:hypothetical protein
LALQASTGFVPPSLLQRLADASDHFQAGGESCL